MTIYEHAMVGVNGALALGLGRRYGWEIVVWAGVAAVLPDCDGLTILLGPQCYAEGHRLWMHNLLVTGLAAAVFSAIVYQTGTISRIGGWFARHLKMPDPLPPTERRAANCGLWILVGIAAAYSHLLADVAFSIGRDMPIWGVPLLWPFHAKNYACPLIRWGDIGATVLFAASMFAMLRWPARTQSIAAASLFTVALYVVLRGLCG